MSVDNGERAPVVLFGYNRPRHLQECISSLRRNAEALKTRLCCFLDGPRSHEDIRAVEEVRKSAREAEGFLQVTVVERDTNLGLSRNIIDGITQVMAAHDTVIVVEDDLVVSPGFLRYMNQALSLYRTFPGVFSVGAYNYPRGMFRVPRDFPYDAFFVPRHMCWGWGTWRDRWEKADWQVRDYPALRRSDWWRRAFRDVGVDLPGMLDEQMRGQVDSWAIRWAYTHFTHRAVCLLPVESLVNNMGVDGSGVHMKASSRYFHQSLNSRRAVRFPPLVYVDPRIARMYRNAGRRSVPVRAAGLALRTAEKVLAGAGLPAALDQLKNVLRVGGKRSSARVPQLALGPKAPQSADGEHAGGNGGLHVSVGIPQVEK